ncbi:MAG: sigma-70 family RNA polymerase sigma factor [Planctomycetota bacterium]|jgi:RNA polymerase sigma-70 factor (ECF subfamily)
MIIGNGSDHEAARLLHAARQGDEEALGQLLDGHRNYLRLLARLEVGRRLQAKIDASDVVQEVFLQAHRAFGDFRGSTEGEVLQWLRKILAAQLSNLIRHYARTKRRDVKLERALDHDLNRSSQALRHVLAISQTSPSQRVARRERAVLLADAVERLPEDYRDVIVLRHLQGLTFPEVAEAMERSEGSVKKLWARALAKLRGELGDSL